MPELTYVIPAYNAAHFIGRAMASIVEQSGESTRIIVVDDGSTDDTLDVASRQKGRLTLLRQPNSGVCAARNHGMRYVETELVCFLDADDYVVGPHRQAMEAIWRDDVDMIIGLRADGDDDQVHLQAKNKYRDDPDPLAILGRFLDDDCVQCSTISWSVAFLKQIGAWDNDMRGIDDIELAMRALLHRPRLRLSEAPAWVVWHNHTHPGRLSQVMDEAVARSHVRAQEKTISLIDSTGAGDEVLRQALQRCMKEGRRLYLNGRPAEAIELFAMARARRYATHYGPRFERLLAAILGTRTVLFLRTVNTSAKHRLRRWLTAFGRPEANTSPAASIH